MNSIDLSTDELKNYFHNLENEKAVDKIFNSKLQEELFKYSDFTLFDLDEYKDYIGDIKTLHDVSDNDFPHTLMSCMEKGGLVETEYGDNKRSFESDFFSSELIDMLNHPETYKNIHSNRDSMIEMYLEDYWGDSVAKEIEMWASYFDDSGYVDNLIDKAVANIEMRNNEMQSYIDAYKEYYNAEKFDVEKDDNAYYFDGFVDDFKAMEGCKTYGELADWFIDYIDNKGVGNGNFTEVLKGEGEYYEELLGYVNDGEYDSVIEAWCDENCFNAIAPWVEKVVNGSINRDEPINEYDRNKLEEWFALEEYENGDDFFAICEKVRETEATANQKTTFTKEDVSVSNKTTTKEKGETK